ncbi:hypothetical protein ACFL0Y_03680 [Patescibacteria group bacterium]
MPNKEVESTESEKDPFAGGTKGRLSGQPGEEGAEAVKAFNEMTFGTNDPKKIKDILKRVSDRIAQRHAIGKILSGK